MSKAVILSIISALTLPSSSYAAHRIIPSNPAVLVENSSQYPTPSAPPMELMFNAGIPDMPRTSNLRGGANSPGAVDAAPLPVAVPVRSTREELAPYQPAEALPKILDLPHESPAPPREDMREVAGEPVVEGERILHRARSNGTVPPGKYYTPTSSSTTTHVQTTFTDQQRQAIVDHALGLAAGANFLPQQDAAGTIPNAMQQPAHAFSQQQATGHHPQGFVGNGHQQHSFHGRHRDTVVNHNGSYAVTFNISNGAKCGNILNAGHGALFSNNNNVSNTNCGGSFHSTDDDSATVPRPGFLKRVTKCLRKTFVPKRLRKNRKSRATPTVLPVKDESC